jgi:LPS-assembly protein
MGASADDARYVAGSSTTLTGDVILNQDDIEIHSPKIVSNEVTQVSEIDGPLQIRKSNQLMTGDHATVNLTDGTGLIDQGTFLLHQSSYRGNAATIKLIENGNILLDDANLTRCDPGSTAWVMNADNMELMPDLGFGVAKNMTIRVKNVPVIYFPYMRFPIDDSRQSGFLLPNIGHDSEGGTDINIPYYFNIAPTMDATYELRSMWKRGLIHDGQFRFMTRRSTNEINGAYLYKDDIYDDRIVIDETSEGAGLPTREFEKQDRWLLNIRHSGGLSSRWKTSINYSAVSDIDYLHDIGGNVGSSAVEQFTSSIGTSFTNRRSAALDRIGAIEYRGDAWNSQLTLQGFQNLDLNTQVQYEKLPSLVTNYFRQLGPFNADLKLEYTFFNKNNTGLVGINATIGERALADFSISWPFREIWGYVQPSIGLIHRKYNLDDITTGSRANPEITNPKLVIDSGLYFDRFFNWGDTRLQQTLEPRLYFLYVDYSDQDDLPAFDTGAFPLSYSGIFRENRFTGYDRIGDAKQFGLGLTTRFLSDKTGVEFLSASIGQIYYLKDRQVVFRPTPTDDPEATESPLFTEARLKLSNGFSMAHTFEWEPSANRTNRSTFSMKYQSGQRKIFNLNYVYTSPDVQIPSLIAKSEESDLNFIWPLVKRWSVVGRWNFGWDDHRTIESFIGLEYNDCCWKSRLIVRRYLKDPRTTISLIDDPNSPGDIIAMTDISTPADVGIFFEFQLKGLATLGKRVDSLLEDGIPGYRNRENLIGL